MKEFLIDCQCDRCCDSSEFGMIFLWTLFLELASFLWVEIGLSVYWPVSCGGNEFLGSILNLSSYISNKFSVFHAQIGSRVSGSERVNQFEHENWERVGNIAGQVENWAKRIHFCQMRQTSTIENYNFYPKEYSFLLWLIFFISKKN